MRTLPGLLLTLLTLLAGCAHTPHDGQRFTLLHTNDHHGHFWRDKEGDGGLAARKTLVDKIRQEVASYGGAVMLLDAGDVNTGGPESDLLNAEPDFRGMSLLGYDAMAVGNHEFDRSPDVQQRQRRDWSNFPWLAANVTRSGQPMFDAYRIFKMGGLRIAVMGLSTDEAERQGVVKHYPGIAFQAPIDAARALVPMLRAQADIVVGLTHMGHYVDGQHGSATAGDVELARAVNGIDLIVGGHTHSLVCMEKPNVRIADYKAGMPCQPDRQNGTWILQAGDRGRYLGRADFIWQQGRLALVGYQLVPVDRRVAQSIGELSLLEPHWLASTAKLQAPVGRAIGLFDGERNHVRHRRTNLGVLIARAMRECVKADVAILSSGGVRASLPDGAISQRDILTVLPFHNRVSYVDLTGSELSSYVLEIAQKSPGTGAFAQFDGLKFARIGGRIEDLRVNNMAIAPDRVYRVALPSFIADAGDGYPLMSQHPRYFDSGIEDVKALSDYFETHGALHASTFNPED